MCEVKRQRGRIRKTEGGCKKGLQSGAWRFKKITYGRERVNETEWSRRGGRNLEKKVGGQQRRH